MEIVLNEAVLSFNQANGTKWNSESNWTTQESFNNNVTLNFKTFLLLSYGYYRITYFCRFFFGGQIFHYEHMQRNYIMEKRQLSYVFNFKLLQGQLNGIFMLFVDDVLVIDLNDINYRQGNIEYKINIS